MRPKRKKPWYPPVPPDGYMWNTSTKEEEFMPIYIMEYSARIGMNSFDSPYDDDPEEYLRVLDEKAGRPKRKLGAKNATSKR